MVVFGHFLFDLHLFAHKSCGTVGEYNFAIVIQANSPRTVGEYNFAVVIQANSPGTVDRK